MTDPGMKKILVIDDDSAMLTLTVKALQARGFQTVTADDGVAGLEMAKKHLPDLIICDIQMPRLNGYEACRRIREQARGRHLVLIALTGWGYDEDRSRSREAGFNFHMVKPVDPDALEKLLAGLLLAPA